MTAGKNLIQAAAGNVGGEFYGYTIDNSCRFDRTGEHTLTRTFSAGDVDNWAVSCWVKICDVGVTSARCEIISAGSPATNRTWIYIDCNTGQFKWQERQSSTILGEKISTRLFRDTSAWYHIFCLYDSDNGTATDRMQVYINGVKETDWATDTTVTSGQNSIMNSAVIHGIGITSWYTSDSADSSYKAQHVFVDGGGVTVDDFGQDKNGVWIPKSPSVTYGTNGHYLAFQDSSNLGDDTSGNTNDWTVSGLTSSDQMIDTPTNNYPTMQGAFSTSATTYSNGNLEAQQDSAGNKHTRASFGLPTTGKWYWEFQFIDARPTDPPGTSFGIGVSNSDGLNDQGYSTGALFWTLPGSVTCYAYQDNAYTSGDDITLSNAVVDGDWFGVAYDADTRKMWLWSERDNTWLASGDPANGTNPWKTLTALSAGQTYFPIGMTMTNDSGRWSKFGFNFGQYAFAGSAPTDFLELNAANLPEPTIGPNSDTTSDENFNAIAYTGNGSQSVTGVGFQPDLVWVKARSSSYYHQLHDAVRGATAGVIYSNVTTAEDSTYQFDSFDSDGFTTDSANVNGINSTGNTFVAWNWKGNGSGSSNTDGTITSTVSANTDAGFSIITYTGAGTGTGYSTIGHGLSQAPEFVILKNRDSAANWYAYHVPGLGTPPLNAGLYLNQSVGNLTSYTYPPWGAFTSTTIALNKQNSDIVGSGVDYVMYAFHSVEGFSKFGTYTGNGSSTDGPFIYTDFRPAFVMIKYAGGAGHWIMYDNARGSYNVNGARVGANLSDSENQDDSNLGVSYSVGIDMLSNGFKIRTPGPNHNTSGGSYIFMAFAENPFKYSNAR